MHIVQAYLGTPESLILLDYTRIMTTHRERMSISKGTSVYLGGRRMHNKNIDCA